MCHIAIFTAISHVRTLLVLQYVPISFISLPTG